MNDLLALLLVVLGGRADGCGVLTGLDVLRAHAYATSDASELAGVYVPGPVLDAEREQLERWTQRGIRLRGVRMERKSCTVVGKDLVVSERLGTTTAVMPNGTERVLPADDWSERRIRLEYVSGRWRIAAVSG